jgi:dephospho-CoA kinase
MESAILYESGAHHLVDRVIVVTAPEDVRIQRIMQRDGISRQQALLWLQRQWPQSELVRRAHYHLVNDGVADLHAQIETLLKTLNNK